MNSNLTNSTLQQDIHNAFKKWHDSDAEESPLGYLQLYQEAKREGSVRQATNNILYEALEILALAHKREAELLRRRFLDGVVMHAVANLLNIGESTAYRMQRDALQKLTLILQDRETRARGAYRSKLEKRLNLPPEAALFGVSEHFNVLRKVLISSTSLCLLCLEGLGGLGKTSMAGQLIRHPDINNRFFDVAWVSAKQQEFRPGHGLDQPQTPALTNEVLIDTLLTQLDSAHTLAKPFPEKQAYLSECLKQNPYLVVIDNLETVVDYQALLPMLRVLSNPSKFLLTSRHSMMAYPDVFCRSLAELDPEAVLEFIRFEASQRGLSLLTQASNDELKHIYDIVGGNPLALKLVIGQISVLPLSQVLSNFKAVRGRSINELFTFIYWEAWKVLDETSQEVLLSMPLAQDGTIAQLKKLTGLTIDQLGDALQHLAKLSLVQVEGDLEDRRYTIHRLTETFLLQETIQWHVPA